MRMALKVGKKRDSVSLFVLSTFLLFSSCSTRKVMDSDRARELGDIKAYDKVIKVRELPTSIPSPTPVPSPNPTPPSSVSNQSSSEEKRLGTPSEEHRQSTKTKDVKVSVTPVPVKSTTEKSKKKMSPDVGLSALEKIQGPRLPELEDHEGFQGRRPKIDPFRVGEKVVLSLSYFNIVAGDMHIEVLPFVEVNERKAYRFRISIKTNSFFSSFYSADDYAETFVDYETLLPFNFEIHVKESKQLREVRSYFDWIKMKGMFWERKVTAEWGTENKEIQWDIAAYSQNVFSAVYYLRAFQLKPGKQLQMRVGDEGRNMIVKGEVLRQEVLKTDAGSFKTVVMEPEIQIEGVFKPVGEILFWLTDDDQKQLIRIESKIKIGKIVGSLKSIERGRRP